MINQVRMYFLFSERKGDFTTSPNGFIIETVLLPLDTSMPMLIINMPSFRN